MKVFNRTGKFLTNLDENKELARGGEGRILEYGSDKVAKLYLPGIKGISEIKFDELKTLHTNIFIKPEELLCNDQGKIIGYSMGRVGSDFYPILSFFNKTFCNREMITSSIKMKVFDKLINAVEFAHSKGIVIGDFNPYNILVNNSGDVYMIDVDSYQTPSFRHSDLLFDDIRDYLYGGEINIKADYFSLAVIVFNMLTYMHPFKGVHKRYPKIEDRMIKKLSVLNPDNELVIPKCYEKITDPYLDITFRSIFVQGDRFLLKNATNIPAPVLKPVSPVVVQTGDVIMKEIFNHKIIKSASSKTLLGIQSEDGILHTYNVSMKGDFIPSKTIQLKNSDLFFIYEDLIFIIENNIFSYYPVNSSVAIPLISLNSLHKYVINQYGNILVLITESNISTIYLNTVVGNSIRYTLTDIYGPSIRKIDSLIQNISGKSHLFYEAKQNLNISKFDIVVKNAIQKENIGLIEALVNDRTIEYKWFTIDRMVPEIMSASFDSLRYFDVLNETIVVVPEDDKLLLIRRTDMQEVLVLNCTHVSKDSVIHCTQAGIIAINDDEALLLNKK